MRSPNQHSRTELSAQQLATGQRLDVAVLIEDELTGTSARQLVDMYQTKNAALRYHLVRPLSDSARADAERVLQRGLERMQALRANVTAVVSDLEPLDALSGLVTATASSEVVVVTARHRLAAFLHRDLASKARTRIRQPLVHVVNR